MTHPKSPRSSSLALALAALVTLPRCILVAEPEPGQISFLWSFDGEPSCTAARVDEVDVFVRGPGDAIEYEALHLACESGGLTLPSIDVGDYTLIVDAYSARGTLLYTGQTAVTVVSGQTTDVGELLLTRPGGADTGDVAFYWTFDGETSCGAAGVDEVDVEIVDEDDASVFAETVTCEGGGLILTEIAPGNHTLYLDAYASDDTYLYAAARSVTVVAGQLTDLGTVDLASLSSGSLLVGWQLPGNATCAAAGVDEVDVEVRQGGATVALETFDCDDLEATLGGLPEGSIEVWLDGYASDNTHLFSSGFTTTIVAGETTDAGTVTLDPVGAGTGTVVFDIGFLYPVSAAETDCVRAGVYEIDVDIAPVGHAGPGYQTTLSCTDDAGSLEVTGLNPGAYTLSLAAYGTYDDTDLLLYVNTPEAFTIVADDTTDLGAVDLPREQDNFGQLDVSWSLDGGDCAALGVSMVSFTVTRTSGPSPVVDDTFTKPCANGSEIRLNYVPGSYSVSATASGTAGTYEATGTTMVAPGASGEPALTLALVD